MVDLYDIDFNLHVSWQDLCCYLNNLFQLSYNFPRAITRKCTSQDETVRKMAKML